MFNRQNGPETNPRHRSSGSLAARGAFPQQAEDDGGLQGMGVAASSSSQVDGKVPDDATSASPGVNGARNQQTRWRLHLYALIPALLMLAGLAVLMYPQAAAWFSQYDQSQLIDISTKQINSGKLTPSIKEQLKEAHEYNSALSAGAVLEANHRIPTGSGTSQDPNESLDYNKILVSPSGVMARLRIPSIDVDLPIYHGTSDETLLKGVGHLEGTSLPVGGVGTHAVLTGHRGLATATMFTNLDKVNKGDTITIEVMDQVLTYRVFDIRVVDPEDTASLKADPKKDLVTLVTCTPLGINSQRILVTGQRVTPTPKKDIEAANKPSDLPGFPWWIVVLSAGLVGTIVFVWRAGYPPKTRLRMGRKDPKRV